MHNDNWLRDLKIITSENEACDIGVNRTSQSSFRSHTIELKSSSLIVYLLVVQLLNAYISFEHLTQNRVSTTIYIHWKFCVDSSQAHG